RRRRGAARGGPVAGRVAGRGRRPGVIAGRGRLPRPAGVVTGAATDRRAPELSRAVGRVGVPGALRRGGRHGEDVGRGRGPGTVLVRRRRRAAGRRPSGAQLGGPLRILGEGLGVVLVEGGGDREAQLGRLLVLGAARAARAPAVRLAKVTPPRLVAR